MKLKSRYWDPLSDRDKTDATNAHALLAMGSIIVIAISFVIGAFIGKWYLWFSASLVCASVWGILVYLCALFSIACIRPKTADDPSILGRRFETAVRFAGGSLLVLLGAGLGLYVQSTGEYLAKQQDFLGFPEYARAYVFGFQALAGLIPYIACFGLLYFGWLTAWDLWRATVAGRLRAAGTLRLLLNIALPKRRMTPLARAVPRWLFELNRPVSVLCASVVVFFTALGIMDGVALF